MGASGTGCWLHHVLGLTNSPTIDGGVVRQLLTNGSTAILIWLDPLPAGGMVKALRAAGFKGTVAGPSWLRCEAFLKATGDAGQGFLIPEIARERESDTVYNNFTGSYRSRFGHEPDAMALYSYDAARLLMELLRRFGAESLRRGAPADFRLPGATGVMRFDALGNRQLTLRVLSVDQGRFIPLPNREPTIRESGRVTGMSNDRQDGHARFHARAADSGKVTYE